MATVGRRTMSVREAAVTLGISERNAFRLAKAGELPTIRLGKRLLVPLAAIERMLADPGAQTPEPASAA